MHNRSARMKALKDNGIDTSKYFTLIVNEDIPAGSKINVEVDRNGEIEKQIVENGYVRNTKLHRRWVAAQYMRMLDSDLGWHGYLRAYYGYMYQFDMMIEEVRVLSKLYKADREAYLERSRFFNLRTVFSVLDDYMNDLRNYLVSLPAKNCKGNPYITVKGYGRVFRTDVDRKIIMPITGMIIACKKSRNYNELYDSLKAFRKVMVELPWNTKKSKDWINAFQSAGAFYTLKNLILFHDVDLYFNGAFYERYAGMNVLNKLADVYEGYQLNALLKKTIEKNNFSFKNSVAYSSRFM